MVFSRRNTIVGAAAAVSVAAMAPKPTRAQNPLPIPSPGQVPGIYRQKVGSILMTCVTDGSNGFPRAESFVSNVSAADVASALEAAFLPIDRITLTFTPVVLNTAGRVVVVDTGLGEAAYKASKGVGGQFNNNLAAAG